MTYLNYSKKNIKIIKNEFYSKTQQAPPAAPPYKVVAIDQSNQNANQIMARRKNRGNHPLSYLVKMEVKK